MKITNVLTQQASMTYTIKEEIQAKYYYYARLAVIICPICEEPFSSIINTDPGSTEEAIGALEVCDKCSRVHGGYVTVDDYKSISWSEYEQRMDDTSTQEEDEVDYTDINKEKWDNYFNDYNQCGVSVSY